MASLTASQLSFIRHASGVFVSLVVTSWWEAGRPATRVTSFVRSVSENRSVGGDPRSQHLIGTAVDLVGMTEVWATRMRTFGLVVLNRGTHYHVQLWPADARAVERIAPQLVSS